MRVVGERMTSSDRRPEVMRVVGERMTSSDRRPEVPAPELPREGHGVACDVVRVITGGLECKGAGADGALAVDIGLRCDPRADARAAKPIHLRGW